MTTAAPPGRWEGTGVTLDEVLARLADLRCPPDGGPPYNRTGVLTLVAHAAGAAEARALERVIDDLADHQPSRSVLVVEEEAGEGIDAAAGLACRDAEGGRSVAMELVRLTLRGRARAGLASAVVPLLRVDLPTVLWWPRAPEADDPSLEALAGLADRMITEAGRCARPADGLRALAPFAARGRPAATDLAWAAITPWRQLLAQMIDPPALAALRSASSVAAVAHPEGPATAEALLLAGWLRDVIGAGLMIELHARPADDAPLMAVELEGFAAGRRLIVERLPRRSSAAVVVVEPGGRSRRRVLPLPHPARAHLIAGELELQRRDRPFERALPHAVALADRAGGA